VIDVHVCLFGVCDGGLRCVDVVVGGWFYGC